MSFGPFSTLLNGLPNMFGLTGQSMPKAMEENIRLTLDTLPFLSGPNAQEAITATGNINAVGLASFAPLIVPSTEAWLVHGFTVGAVTGAAEVLRMRPVLGRILGGGNIVNRVLGYECASSLTDAAAASSLRCGVSGPMVVYGGEFLGVDVTRITTAGVITLFGQASIFRFTL